MADRAPLVTILCSQRSKHAQMRQGEDLPEGWIDRGGQLICSEMCEDILQSMGLLQED